MGILTVVEVAVDSVAACWRIAHLSMRLESGHWMEAWPSPTEIRDQYWLVSVGGSLTCIRAFWLGPCTTVISRICGVHLGGSLCHALICSYFTSMTHLD